MIVSTATTSFIETQFPVSKLSKESYKERKAVAGQTLTGLGKWWGRKPLILVRAAILGLLLPASDDPQWDRDIFLKLLTMDDEGLWRRKSKAIPVKDIYTRLPLEERERWFEQASETAKPTYRKEVSRQERDALQRTVFKRLSYDEKLVYCDRPEQIDGPSEAAWAEINAHLETEAQNLPDLVRQLGERQFGHVPRVGDAFCGGGSVPFEAARLGCEAYGSDLNPVAALLTWAALHIVGGGPDVAGQVRHAQQEVYEAVDQQITAWGIEHNELGWRADAYLYCNEVTCPECGWRVPLAPSWVIGEKTRCIASLRPDVAKQRFDIRIESGVSAQDVAAAKTAATVKSSALVCPHCRQSTPMAMLRGDRRVDGNTSYGLRLWENDDLVPRPDDVFQERLYCIRWVETLERSDGTVTARRHYRAPDKHDLQREEKVLHLLRKHFHTWQEKGYLPSRRIEPGYNTDQPIRERGWTHWHHLFHPRQLLVQGLLAKHLSAQTDAVSTAACLLGLGRCLDRGSKLCVWDSGMLVPANTFLNQALNTLTNYGIRAFLLLINPWYLNIKFVGSQSNSLTSSEDARNVSTLSDIWITDPPYADAVNYHELSEFFLAWYEKPLQTLFPEWYVDSKRALAITGADEGFRKSMVDCYRNLAKHMPDNGFQIVMFTHQNASVWADLALILWASGLQVTAAWTIATETESALKVGNYVQGTVLLILRKQTSNNTAFLDEIYPEVEHEVKAQLDAMLALEDQEDPNFGDTDYQLAAYAAALRVLTQYNQIEDIDIAYELSKPRRRGEVSPIEQIIADAVKVACDHLVPQGFDTFVWKTLTPAVASGSDWNRLRDPDKSRIRRMARDFSQQHNPFIRHIVRRTRGCLETTLDPETGEPYLKPVRVELLGERDEEAIPLPLYLQDAYKCAEACCQLIARRTKGAGFLKTLLLRRVGSTMYAGRKTAETMLGTWQHLPDDEDEDDERVDDETFSTLTAVERAQLQAFIDALEANQDRDPKCGVVLDLLVRQGWIDDGCIIFSQYYDSVGWLAQQVSREIPAEPIGIYAGGARSGVIMDGVFTATPRDDLKQCVQRGEVRLLLGTDAASEGLNLQRLGTLINLDLPWNPTRLEQRKGRIQRIGQLRDMVRVYNMRYKNSVEDRVHELLSERLEGIHTLFGQLPDVLEDVWIHAALGQIEEAKKTIDAVPRQHPFHMKYHKITKTPWESCAQVLDATDRQRCLSQGWGKSS